MPKSYKQFVQKNYRPINKQVKFSFSRYMNSLSFLNMFEFFLKKILTCNAVSYYKNVFKIRNAKFIFQKR